MWPKEEAKSFHTILNIPKPHFPPQADGRAVCSVCSLAASNTVFGPKMSKNSLNCPLLLTRGDRHFFTDTLCPTPVNCCWRPASQDFLEIRFLFQRNPIFLGREILFPNLTNPFVKCLARATQCGVARREAYWQSRLS